MTLTTTRVTAALTAIALALTPATATANPADSYEIAHNLTDTDGDGIPDEWEKHGFTDENGNEYPINLWGADPNKPDLFLQLNWMYPANGNDFAPEKNELVNLIEIFDSHGFNLHIDAGDVYTNIPTDAYEPRGGETLDYKPYYIEDELPYELYDQADVQLGNYANIFRSGVVVDNVKQNARMSGLALVGGKSFVATKQRTGDSTDRVLSHVILHEFGHTLGLTHSGSSGLPSPGTFDPHYPNYYSVMNYLYMYDTLNYSEEVAVDTPELPEKCAQTYLECFAGTYYIPKDWETLQIPNMGFEDVRGKTGTTVKVTVKTKKTPRITATSVPTATKTSDTVSAPEKEKGTSSSTSSPDAPTTTNPVVEINLARSEGKTARNEDDTNNVSTGETQTVQAPVTQTTDKGSTNSDATFGIVIGILTAISVALSIAGIGYILGS